jgi:N-formylmaleamate deformylase
MSDWKKGQVAVSNGFLAYHRTKTQGTPLVLSHGLTDNGLCWRRVGVELSANFDVIMIDARGHGESSRVSGADEYDPAQDIGEVIEALDLVEPIVMGHSVGGRATAAYANSPYSRASKVILEDPAFVPLMLPEALEARQTKFRGDIEKMQALTFEEIVALGKSQNPDWDTSEFPDWAVSKQQVDATAFPDFKLAWQSLVPNIKAPTLIIYGESERGSIVTAKLAGEARKLNPLLSSVQIANAGHNIRRENFFDYLACVKKFLGVD